MERIDHKNVDPREKLELTKELLKRLEKSPENFVKMSGVLHELQNYASDLKITLNWGIDQDEFPFNIWEDTFKRRLLVVWNLLDKVNELEQEIANVLKD